MAENAYSLIFKTDSIAKRHGYSLTFSAALRGFCRCGTTFSVCLGLKSPCELNLRIYDIVSGGQR